MAKDKKKQKKDKKQRKAEKKAAAAQKKAENEEKRSSFFGILGRKSSADASKRKESVAPTPQDDNLEKSQQRRKSRKPGFLSKKANAGEEAVNPGATSYSRNKPRKMKLPKKKPKKKQEIVIKRGNVQRSQNKYYPGTVSYKYTSPKEVWVDFLGNRPEINDFGNGARLILDETSIDDSA